MSYKQYVIIKKAAEYNLLSERITNLSDMSAAFSGDNDYMKRLINELEAMDLQFGDKKEESKSTKGWADKLRRFMR